MNKSAVVFAIGLLVFGALNTLSTKFTFQMQARDLTGEMHSFQKPWFGVYRMFQGMAFVMLLHFGSELKNWNTRRNMRAGSYLMETSGGNGSFESTVPKATPFTSYVWVAVPAALDLFGTTCTYVGLFYNTPSVWQMFRGAMVVFATFFSIVFLKRKLNLVRWLGVALVVLAITIVGTANMQSADSANQLEEVDTSLKLFGMGMILLGMFLQGGQIVVEEFLMKGVDAPPLMVVGMEGVWGCIIMWVLVFPIVQRLPGDDYGGVMESLQNDIAMVNSSKDLQMVILVYLFSVFTFNIAGMMVTYALSAVHRTMLEASRTAVIWAIDLTIHAYWPNSVFGEVWNAWSVVQLFGFVLLVLGQATYAELITWGMQTSKTIVPEVVMSPACNDPGMFASPSARSPAWLGSPGRTAMASPKGQLDMGVDLPVDEGYIEQLRIDQGKGAVL